MTDETETLRDVSHTNPYTGAVFGETQAYSRGKIVVADGGEAGTTETSEADGGGTETLADVKHTAPDDTEATQRTFERGGDR